MWHKFTEIQQHTFFMECVCIVLFFSSEKTVENIRRPFAGHSTSDENLYLYLYICICIYVFVYMYLYICICICIVLFVSSEKTVENIRRPFAEHSTSDENLYLYIYLYFYLYFFVSIFALFCSFPVRTLGGHLQGTQPRTRACICICIYVFVYLFLYCSVLFQ